MRSPSAPAQVDDDGSGSIEFPEFLKVIEAQKEAATQQNDESDLIDAFVAMGGNIDKTGHVEAEKLRRTIKAFELTVDIDRLIDETDTDGEGPYGRPGHALPLGLFSVATLNAVPSASLAASRYVLLSQFCHVAGSGEIDYEEFKAMFA